MSYIVRVELHGAVYSDYETLHAAMAQAGFQRTITSDNGTVYQLPTAEYSVNSSADEMAVLKAARLAADRTGKRNGVLVVASNRSAWDGLAQVR